MKWDVSGLCVYVGMMYQIVAFHDDTFVRINGPEPVPPYFVLKNWILI